MKIRCLSRSLFLALTCSLAVACGGAEEQMPPPTTPPPAPSPAQTANTSPEQVTTTQEAVKAPEPEKKAEPPAPKPLKERIVGTWVLDFSGETKTTAETDAKKKAGKDEKKLADLMKKAEETTAKEKIETAGDTLIVWSGDKTTSKAKYEVVKEEGNTLTLKRVGKDEITKKDAAAGDIQITFKDDSTIELKDLREKDAKKAKVVVYKKGGATPATPATPASPGATGGGATPATPATPAAPASDKAGAGAAKPAETGTATKAGTK